MFTIYEVIKNPANVLRYVNKNGRIYVEDGNKSLFAILRSSDYKKLLKEHQRLLDLLKNK